MTLREGRISAVYGKQRLFQHGDRLHIAADLIAVALDGTDDHFIDAFGFQYLPRLDTVGIGVQFIIDIVQQTDHAPQLLVLAIESGEVPHSGFYRHAVFLLTFIFDIFT